MLKSVSYSSSTLPSFILNSFSVSLCLHKLCELQLKTFLLHFPCIALYVYPLYNTVAICVCTITYAWCVSLKASHPVLTTAKPLRWSLVVEVTVAAAALVVAMVLV